MRIGGRRALRCQNISDARESELCAHAGARRRLYIAPPHADRTMAACRRRELAPGAAELLGQPVVVENRPGEG
jgi:hypothetical protein